MQQIFASTEITSRISSHPQYIYRVSQDCRLKFPLNLFVTYFHIPSFCFFVQTGQKGFRRCKALVSDDILMRSIMVTRCEVDAPVVTPAPDFHFLTIQSFYDLLLYED